MERTMSILSSSPSVKTKDDLIQQAHEARQARELTRHRESAAITILAFLKAVHTRRSLKTAACDRLKEICKLSVFQIQNNDMLISLRQALFVCDRDKDRDTLDSLIEFILVTSTPRKNNLNSPDQENFVAKSDTPQSLIEEAIQESLELSRDRVVHSGSCEDVQPSHEDSKPLEYENFVTLMIDESSKSEQSLSKWTELMERILNLCLEYLKDANSTRLDSQHIDTYLQLINIFTSSNTLISMVKQAPEDLESKSAIDGYAETSVKISSMLTDRTLFKEKSFFNSLTNLICEKIGRFRNDLKASILSNYSYIAFKLMHLDNSSETFEVLLTRSKSKCLVDILISMLGIPGFIYILDKHSPETLEKFNEQMILKISLRLFAADQVNFQRLTSTVSLCILANLVHLASLNWREEVMMEEKMMFVTVLTKLLESCQKNMLQSSSTITSNLSCPDEAKLKKNKNEPMDVVSFNPLLGWLAREEAKNFDKDILKSQLRHLWSMRFLKVLLSDLTKANEKLSVVHHSGNKAQASNFKQTKNQLNNQPPMSCDDNSPINMPLSLFKRAVERATNSMTKTINSSYSKTSRPSGSSACAKLLTPEANRISLVCLMLHTTLKTLKTLKQDILAGLCLHDYLVPNLWTFISSLGPHNGLRVFLEHLSICTKTSAPEFHILTLFCECTSHLISILDDTELYEKQQPFQLEDLITISAFLNNFVFRIINSNLIPHTAQERDPILQTTHKLLTDLYKRDCRRKFAPSDHWLIKDIKISLFLKDLEAEKPVAKTIMTMLPHIIPHKERVLIFRKLVAKDKGQYCTGPSTLVTIHRSRIVEDGYQQLARLPPHALKGLIRVKFINDYGLDEAGIDQDGVFKEFLEDTIKRVFDPALNLFCSTSEQLLYPSPTSKLHEDYLSLFNFVGKMLGKAIYEGIVVDVPFASFFLSRVLGQPQSPLYSPIDELPSLDPELYKSLTYIKHYEGDVSELDLTFSIDQDFMGKIETHELASGGRSIPVTRETRVRYIHSVANFRIKTQIEKQTSAFVSGFKSIINLKWLSMFSASEFQRLISGDNTPIDLQDLRRHTKYFGGFHNNHRVVSWLWDILENDFTSEEHKLFLKFVTSCSKPPLLGFANLEPPFSIRCVEVSDDQDLGDTFGSVLRGFFAIRRSDPVDRLPTSSTCFNLLKLPNYQRRSTLREKLRYAIKSNPGFELS